METTITAVEPTVHVPVLHRTLDGRFLTRIANDPSVRPFIGGEDGPLDLKRIIADPANVALESRHGGFLVVAHEMGLYEVHSLFLPEGRGKESLAAMREGLHYMFTRTICHELVTMVPDNNLSAEGLTKMAGFTKRFSRAHCFPVPGGDHGATFYGLTVLDWIQHSSACLDAGEQFHAAIEEAKIARGSKRPIHDDDPCHDHAAGAAVLMAKAGNPARAVMLYNRWAKCARYEPIALVSECPAVIDIGDAVLQVHDGEMEILLCR